MSTLIFRWFAYLVFICRIRDGSTTRACTTWKVKMTRRIHHSVDLFEVVESILQAVALCVLVCQLFLQLLDLVLRLLFFLRDLFYVCNLLFQPFLKIELHKDAILLEIKQMSDVLFHGFVLFLEFNDACQALHEEIHRISECLF